MLCWWSAHADDSAVNAQWRLPHCHQDPNSTCRFILVTLINNRSSHNYWTVRSSSTKRHESNPYNRSSTQLIAPGSFSRPTAPYYMTNITGGQQVPCRLGNASLSAAAAVVAERDGAVWRMTKQHMSSLGLQNSEPQTYRTTGKAN